jgi:hypothetical protein
MNDSVRELLKLFWIFLGVSLLTAAFCWVLIRRRHWWLRVLDAEESFWLRFGIPKGGSFRKFGESRFFTISFIVYAAIFLLMALTALGLYFHFRQRS